MAEAKDFERVFIGVIPNSMRKYLKALFEFTLKKAPNLVITTAGDFNVVKCAILAGYKKENIIASDISLYSSLLGYFYSNQNIEELDFTLAQEHQEEFNSIKEQSGKIAFIFWLMKVSQFNEKVEYENFILKEYVANKYKYIKQVDEVIKKNYEIYKGINYKVIDLKQEMEQEEYNSEDVLLITDPPTIKGGYEKMFNFGNAVTWNVKIDEFLPDEFNNLYNEIKKKKYQSIWYKNKEIDVFDDEDVIFAKERNVDRFTYLLATKPKKLEGFPYLYNNSIDYKPLKCIQKFKKLKIFDNEDVIKEDTEIKFIMCNSDVAMYYRDLWVHKFGISKAEKYFVVLLDNKIFGIIGFILQDLCILRTDELQCNFAFTPRLKKYPSSNRLLTMLMTSVDIVNLIKKCNIKNRIFIINAFKTSCFSKYRKVKIHNNLLEISSREKLPDDTYHIKYKKKLVEESFQERLLGYLIYNKEKYG